MTTSGTEQLSAHDIFRAICTLDESDKIFAAIRKGCKNIDSQGLGECFSKRYAQTKRKFFEGKGEEMEEKIKSIYLDLPDRSTWSAAFFDSKKKEFLLDYGQDNIVRGRGRPSRGDYYTRGLYAGQEPNPNLRCVWATSLSYPALIVKASWEEGRSFIKVSEYCDFDDPLFSESELDEFFSESEISATPDSGKATIAIPEKAPKEGVEWVAAYLNREIGKFYLLYGKGERPEYGTPHAQDKAARCVFYEGLCSGDDNDNPVYGEITGEITAESSLYWDRRYGLTVNNIQTEVHYVDFEGNKVNKAGEKLVRYIDFSLDNQDLYRGCEIDETAGKLISGQLETRRIVSKNIAAMTLDKNEVILTGPIISCGFYDIMEAIVGRTNKIYYYLKGNYMLLDQSSLK